VAAEPGDQRDPRVAARAREIGAKLRLRAAQTRDQAQAVVKRITGELAGLAERAAADAEQLLLNARRDLRRAQVKGTKSPPLASVTRCGTSPWTA
jgi:IS5 family transposase